MSTPAVQRRLSLASRSLAAIVGGYAFAHAATAFLVLVLPFSRADRVITATLLAFAVWCAIAVYAFVSRKSWHAWALICIGGALLYGAALLFPELAARA